MEKEGRDGFLLASSREGTLLLQRRRTRVSAGGSGRDQRREVVALRSPKLQGQGRQHPRQPPAARRSVSRGPGCGPDSPHPVGPWTLYAVSLFLRM